MKNKYFSLHSSNYRKILSKSDNQKPYFTPETLVAFSLVNFSPSQTVCSLVSLKKEFQMFFIVKASEKSTKMLSSIDSDKNISVLLKGMVESEHWIDVIRVKSPKFLHFQILRFFIK